LGRSVTSPFREDYNQPIKADGLAALPESFEQMKEALQKSQENLQAVMNALPESFHLIDTEGIILASNEISPKRLGINLDEYIGTNIFSHLPPVIAEKRKEYFNKALHEKIPVNWMDKRDNRYYTHHIIPVLDDRGNVSRIAHIALDITERKRIEDSILESEEKYRNLIEMSPDAILIHQQGRIVYANPATMKLYGSSNQEDVVGRNMFDLIHPDFHESIQRNIKNAVHGTTTPPTELQIIRNDGTLATFEGRGKRLLYRGQPSIQVVLRDISARKKAEQQLREYADDLELFIHIATHDLQEPLRGIVTYAQLLLNQYREGKTSNIEKYLKVIENAGLKMNSLVNDLREYSRVRTHKNPLEPVDMGEVLSNALNNLHLMVMETQAFITNDPLPTVPADAPQMTQVFQNIIDNAIKFRAEGSRPKIHISASASHDLWRFAVKDNGIGIPSQYTDKIFVLFERLHGKDDYPGTGLGLALCKKIIERHGGRIWVESEVGNGSTFFFTLKDSIGPSSGTSDPTKNT
jgi:PAS domain S-box-containing protein